MKRAMFSALAVVVLAGLAGCITQRGARPTACMGGSCAQAPENCQSCSDPGDNCSDPGRASQFFQPCREKVCRLCGRDRDRGCQCASAGPPTGAITYPYYTNRGPRDFLAKDPPSIGP
jgi:hypothetical protein